MPAVWIKDLVEYGLVCLFGGIARRLSWAGASRMGAALGGFVFWAVGFRRGVTMGNLSRAFGGERSPEGVRRIGLDAYRNFGRTLGEFLWFRRLGAEGLSRAVTMENPEVLEEAMGYGRGALVLSGHFGNWELLAAAIAGRIGGFKVVVAPMRNRRVDRAMGALRRAVGVEGIYRGEVEAIVGALRRRECVGIVADQDAGPEGAFVSFFGRMASTPRGPAVMALRWDLPVVMGFLLWEGGERHRAVFEWVRRPGEGGEVEGLTQRYTALLEGYVRRYPDHWLWLHRRWKSASSDRQSAISYQPSAKSFE